MGDPDQARDASSEEPHHESDRSAQPVDAEEPPRLPFPVVGVGASAGGLEAFLDFFKAMPPDSGMAFVLIQHLPPDRESLIAEILSNHTRMTVLQVEDGMRVQANHVYIIRPGYTLTLKDGALHLGDRLEKPGHSRPVDDFFKSLAEEQRERAICILMSGMGSNGTAGAQAVKAVGGVGIAQEPESAKFPSMPRHMIDAGYADFILRPQDMPEVLLRYARHPYARGRDSADAVLRQERQHFHEIVTLLRARTRQDFSGYKKPTILRRIQRRMGLNQSATMAEYVRLLRQTPSEIVELSDDLMIHVTGFFRDADAWETLRERVIVPLIAEREVDGEVRCWVTACSSGEEAYTLAMLLTEAAERMGKRLDIKVFATDMADRSIAHARSGVYPGGIEAEITPERLERFFDREDAVYRVKRALREQVVFAPQNILQDPPFSRLDIASCRNMLIYLEPEMQRRVLSLLHFGLREGGTLFLGTSETVGPADDLFEPLDKKWKIYRRVGPTRHGTIEFPILAPRRSGGGGGGGGEREPLEARSVPKTSIAQLTNKALLDRYTPAAVTVDREHRIVYFHGNTDGFLSQPRGEPTRDLLAMTRKDLRGAVRTALQRAAAQSGPVTARDGVIETAEGPCRVYVSVEPLEAKLAPGYYLVSFEAREEPQDAPSPVGAGGADNERELRAELQHLRDELQSTVETLQATNEEMKASSEEATSINEELQSTNEELETSKEELQSLNEELTTVNAQLQTKMEEQEATSNDLSSLLSSTDIAVIFLDTRFRIRRYTPAVKDLLELIPADVGRPINDLRKKFEDPDLLEDARAVLDRLVPVTREITSDSKRWYVRRVLPYRTADNRIDGVVVTFVDITERTEIERALREAKEQLSVAHRAARSGTWVRDLASRTVFLSAELCEVLGVVAHEGRSMTAEAAKSFQHPDERGHADRLLADKIARGDTEWNEVARSLHATRGWLWLESRGKIVYDDAGVALRMIGISTDVTERRRAEEEVERSQRLFKRMVEASPDVVFIHDLEADRTTYVSSRSGELLDYVGPEVAGMSNWIVTRMVHPEDALKVAEHLRAMRAIEDGQVYEFDYRSLPRDGVYRCIHARSTVFSRSEDGRVHEVIGFLEDVTERRRAEDNLRASEERFRLLVEGAKDFALVMMDVEGRIVSWNSGAERVLGFSEVDAVEQSIALIYTPEDRAAGAPEAELETARKTGRAIDERWHMRKDGSRLWGSGVLTALRNEATGALRGFVKVLRDETARRQAEAERDALLEREKAARRDAEEATHARDQFLATVSHELRTPLSVILLWVKMLHNGMIGPERTGEGLQAIRRSAEAQKQLIDDLMDTSRIQSGKLHLERQHIDLTSLVQAAVDTILPTAEAKRIQVEADLEQGIGTVSADPDRLRQVIWNLLSNAVKFTPTGGQVSVEFRRQESEIELRVTDTGKGIEPDFLGRVFAPFSQVDAASTRVHGGLGLGLAISKELVELHGGTIRVESPGPGQGATFTVRLPMPEVQQNARAVSTGVAAPPAPSASQAGEARLAGVRILLVEDAKETREILSLLLRQQGAQVTAVPTAATALEAYEQQRPDLIVSDIGLPLEDGYALMSKVRSLEASRRADPVPAVALTAFAQDEDSRRALRAGFHRHLGKPVEPEQLIWELTQVLAKE